MKSIFYFFLLALFVASPILTYIIIDFTDQDKDVGKSDNDVTNAYIDWGVLKKNDTVGTIVEYECEGCRHDIVGWNDTSKNDTALDEYRYEINKNPEIWKDIDLDICTVGWDCPEHLELEYKKRNAEHKIYTEWKEIKLNTLYPCSLPFEIEFTGKGDGLFRCSLTYYDMNLPVESFIKGAGNE